MSGSDRTRVKYKVIGSSGSVVFACDDMKLADPHLSGTCVFTHL